MGGVAFLAVFVPDYGHFRSGAVIGILTTTVTSFYMFIAALSIGQVLGFFNPKKLQESRSNYVSSYEAVMATAVELLDVVGDSFN